MSQLDPDYVLQLLQALQADYPKLQQLIGEDYFTVLACRYLKDHLPGVDGNERFGEQLPVFMQGEVPYANVPSLAELANFEMALRQSRSFVEVDSIRVDDYCSWTIKQRAGQNFGLHPSLIMLKLDWNVPDIWQALSAGSEVPDPQRQASYWLLYGGPDGESVWRRATPLEVAALESVYHGLTWQELCNELCNLIDDTASAASIAENFVHSWLEQGLLVQRLPVRCP